MKQHSIESTLSGMKAPTPDSQARLRAKRAAMAEYARVHASISQGDRTSSAASQGFWNPLRLFRDGSSHGRTSMTWFVSRNVFAGAAGVCVVGLGIAMVWPIFESYAGRSISDTTRPVDTELPPQGPVAEVETVPFVSPNDAAVSGSKPKPAAKETAGRQSKSAEGRVRFRVQPAPPIVTATPAGRVQIDERIFSGSRASPQPYAEFKKDAYTSLEPIQIDGVEQLPVKSTGGSLQRLSGVGIAGNVSPSVRTVLPMTVPQEEAESRDKFQHFELNPLRSVADDPVSTFSVDVDTASYSFSRRILEGGTLPQKDAVRVEEMINYFDYEWPAPRSPAVPFQPTVVVSDSPWAKGKRLVHIGIKGYEIERREAPDSNLVLLLDVSGSMNSPDKLPLAVQSMELLLESLKSTDTVGIVVYAGAAGTVLEPTPVRQKERILEALRSLRPGGSTAGAEGIERAYQLAQANFRKGGVNRILLATDGDFNVGIDDTEQLKGYIERQREKGIFLSVLGFGQGNYRDELAQALAQNGNGVATYIDTLREARKVLVQEATSSLFTIAKDVKLQVEFNPATVAEYRLVGYETRALKREDFNNDAIDAGDVGSGHTVTAIYEVTPVGSEARMTDEPRYSENRPAARSRDSRNEYGWLKIRYKLPAESQSRLLEQPIPLDTGPIGAELRREVQFSTAVAGFGQLLRGGQYTGAFSYEDVIREAQGAIGEDRFGYRGEFVQLVRKAQAAQRK
jgi:Ca-activated chloride channel family protein